MTFGSSPYSWNQANLFPVYWVHRGLGIDKVKEKNAYSSKRFNRAEISSKYLNDVYFNLKPNAWESSIKITYEAKSAPGGESFLYANVFDVGNPKVIFRTHQKNPVIATGWEAKELIIENHAPIEKINFGLMTTKAGSAFRNVQLYYLNKEREWIPYELPAFTSRAWMTNQPNVAIERNDKTFKFLENSVFGTKPSTITWNPYTVLSLSGDLTVTVPSVVYSNETETLPIADSVALNGLQAHLKPENFNTNIAIANVIMSWNIFKHFYPYQDVVKVDWDKLLERSLKDAFDDQDEYDNYRTLARFSSAFDDGHASVFYPGLNEKRKYAPGIALRYTREQLLVKNTLPEVAGIQKGDVITKINGVPTQDYVNDLQQYISGSKQYKNWLSPAFILRGTKDSPLVFTLQNGTDVQLKRTIEYTPNIDFYTKDDVTKAKAIDADTYYVNMDKLSEKEMEHEIPKIRKYKNLIIDLRGYPRTDQSHRLLNYMLPQEDSTQWLCGKEILLPDFGYFTEQCHGHGLRRFISDHPLKTKNILLVDERSVSNAEMFAQVVKHYQLATIIGRLTAGANGNRNDIYLLNGLQIGFTGLKVTNPDGSRFHAIGVIPDIILAETAADMRQGKDVYIEKALEVLKKSF